MRITLHQTVLATDASPARVRNFRIEAERSVQENRLLRAATAQFQNRANYRTRVSFEVVRNHASVREAETFLLGHGQDLPATGLAVFTGVNDAGAATTRYLSNAVIESLDGSGAGTTTRHRYVLRGGQLQSTAPATT